MVKGLVTYLRDVALAKKVAINYLGKRINNREKKRKTKRGGKRLKKQNKFIIPLNLHNRKK